MLVGMRKPTLSNSWPWIQGRDGAHQQGFTLIEMLLVMTIAGVLSAIAAPSFSQLATSLQLTSATNAVVASLHLARNEAIKRNARVVVCKTSDGIGCAADGGWEQGWIVFHDVNNNGLREATEPVIQRQLALSSSLRVTGNATATFPSSRPAGRSSWAADSRPVP
jgi:type IV fimbrial biogenesis protein FimT